VTSNIVKGIWIRVVQFTSESNRKWGIFACLSSELLRGSLFVHKDFQSVLIEDRIHWHCSESFYFRVITRHSISITYRTEWITKSTQFRVSITSTLIDVDQRSDFQTFQFYRSIVCRASFQYPMACNHFKLNWFNSVPKPSFLRAAKLSSNY